MLTTDEAMLDNPAYASLCGAHARLAQVLGRAPKQATLTVVTREPLPDTPIPLPGPDTIDGI